MLRVIPKGKVICEVGSDWLGHVKGQLEDWIVAFEWEADPDERRSYKVFNKVFNLDDLWIAGGICYVVHDQNDIAALVKSWYVAEEPVT